MTIKERYVSWTAFALIVGGLASALAGNFLWDHDSDAQAARCLDSEDRAAIVKRLERLEDKVDILVWRVAPNVQP
jgi:hypothetical protein